MKPTVTLAEAETPAGGLLALLEHDGHYYLQLDGLQLQSSFAHGAALHLARLACAPFRPARQPRLLLAGLGLGYLLAAARECLPQKRASFLVAEPLKALPPWHREFLANLHPGQLDDPRLHLTARDLLTVLRSDQDGFHAILLDADGLTPDPELLDRKGVPSSSFLHQAHSSLKEGGLLAVSCSIDPSVLDRRLRQAGFDVVHESVPDSHKGKQKRRSTIWLARKGVHQKRRPGPRDTSS